MKNVLIYTFTGKEKNCYTASLEGDDGRESVKLVAHSSKSPRAVCLQAAKRLEDAANSFRVWAKEDDPLKVELKSNNGEEDTMNKGTWLDKGAQSVTDGSRYMLDGRKLVDIIYDGMWLVDILPTHADRSMRMHKEFESLEEAKYHAEKALEMIYTRMGDHDE